jgi:hypothetical protein
VTLDKKTTDAVAVLHKGRGVRDKKLSELVLGSGLARQWRIVNSDDPTILRAKVIYRLEQAFQDSPKPDVHVAPVIYNTVADSELHDAQLGQRVASLPVGFPELSVAARSVDRIIARLRQQITNQVDVLAAPFHDHAR